MRKKVFLAWRLAAFWGGVFVLLVSPVVVHAQPTPPCGSFGDVDGDGFVTSADGTLIAQHLVNLITLTASQQQRADVNGDGTVTIADSQLIANYELGVINTFPACAGFLTWLISAPTGPQSGVEVVVLAEQLTNWLFAGFFVLALLFIVLAAWQFISSQGDPQGVGQARSKLFWAAVAIIAAVFARAIPTVIRAIIGG